MNQRKQAARELRLIEKSLAGKGEAAMDLAVSCLGRGRRLQASIWLGVGTGLNHGACAEQWIPSLSRLPTAQVAPAMTATRALLRLIG